jgi:formate hydrogenlyase transcriptional activator
MSQLDHKCPEAVHLNFETFQKAPDAIVWIDEDGGILQANDAACNRLGYSQTEIATRSILEIDADGILNRGGNVNEMYLRGDRLPHETQFLTNTGEWLPVEINAARVQFQGRERISLFVRDLSSCRQSERKYRQNEERLRAIGDALPDLVFVIDEEGRHLEVLTAHHDLLFTSIENILNRRLHEIFDPALADRFLNLIRQTLQTQKTGIMEYELPIRGVSKYFEVRTAALRQPIDGKRCCLWIARDITERKHTEDLARQNIYLQEQLQHQLDYGDIIGVSEAMQNVFHHIDRVAATDATVLLTGETGTGKQMVARAIHQRSRRKERVLIEVNCSALPANLIESELFGHEKGAFTGAASQKQGRFELAHKGTLFLDEVGDLAPEIQTKLLRVLQEQEFERVGGTRTHKVDIRIIAATNRDLEEDIKSGRFRSDLYYRLNIFPIFIPPLRERREDIAPLVNYFLHKFSSRMGKQIKSIHPLVLDMLMQSEWPGNVRELANIMERAVIFCEGETLQPSHINGLSNTIETNEDFLSMEQLERRHILEALRRANGVLAGPKGAAAMLGLNRSTLWSRMRKLGISLSKNFH